MKIQIQIHIKNTNENTNTNTKMWKNFCLTPGCLKSEAVTVKPCLHNTRGTSLPLSGLLKHRQRQTAEENTQAFMAVIAQGRLRNCPAHMRILEMITVHVLIIRMANVYIWLRDDLG